MTSSGLDAVSPSGIHFASSLSVTLLSGAVNTGAPDAYVFPSAGGGGDAVTLQCSVVVCPTTDCSAMPPATIQPVTAERVKLVSNGTPSSDIV